MKDLKKLYLEITKDRGEPLDAWEIAALLEVYGIRDIDAKKEYGFKDVFDMAKELYKYKDIKTYPVKRIVSQEKLPPLKRRIIKNYLKGLAFALPMLVQIVATIVFGYALWSNVDIEVTEATMIAFGTFLAMIITGGPAQILGRKGLYYLKMNEYVLAAKTMHLLYRLSVGLIFLVGFIFYLANIVFGMFEDYLFYVFISTFLLLSILFLNSAIYYVFEEYEKVLYFFVFGLILVMIIHEIFNINFPDAQFLALLLLDVIMGAFAFFKVEKLRKRLDSEGEILPRASMFVYTLMPFFIYGLFYFIFLVLDKLIEWNANGIDVGFFIWFDVEYEIGTDLALMVLIVLMGFVEVVVYEFLYRINDKVFFYSLKEFREFNRDFVRFYRIVNQIFIVFAMLTIVSLYLLILSIPVDEKTLPFTPSAQFVYLISSIAYAFLTNALLNVLVLFSFSRQQVVVKAIVTAVLVDFAVGIVLSKMLAKFFAVFGLLAGSVVFWYITYRYIKKMFTKLDYFYYSAY
ncbi:MAG: hypothetical protein GXO61_00655 [Epsilonproteobacteria bacterium]|nr:hypothetical protein [Campylobacterota bacterium]